MVQRFRWASSLEGVDLLGDGGLAVSSVVLVDNTLANSLVQLTAGGGQSRDSNILVGSLDGGVYRADSRLQLGLNRVVALAGLLVGENALLLGLNIGHLINSLCNADWSGEGMPDQLLTERRGAP